MYACCPCGGVKAQLCEYCGNDHVKAGAAGEAGTAGVAEPPEGFELRLPPLPEPVDLRLSIHQYGEDVNGNGLDILEPHAMRD
jgi:hypothetical protein